MVESLRFQTEVLTLVSKKAGIPGVEESLRFQTEVLTLVSKEAGIPGVEESLRFQMNRQKC